MIDEALITEIAARIRRPPPRALATRPPDALESS
jgi:hypothetical protein